VLLAWQQNGAIYAHMIRQSGATDRTQRVGPSGPDPQLTSVVSDNDHGMIAWSTTSAAAGGAPTTRVYESLSAVGVRFGRPTVLTRFADPERVGSRRGSLKLQRLSTENVMLAWTTVENGGYVVRAAPAVFAATRPTTLLSDPRSQAFLGDLAPGPASEAIALWSTAPRLADGTLDRRRTSLWAARTYIVRSHVVFGRPQLVARAAANAHPAVAVNPADDRAVAAWLALDPVRVEYAVAGGAARYRHSPPAAVPAPATGTHWLRITAGVLVVILAVALLALAGRRRARMRRH
jgi:hypothetical protein